VLGKVNPLSGHPFEGQFQKKKIPNPSIAPHILGYYTQRFWKAFVSIRWDLFFIFSIRFYASLMLLLGSSSLGGFFYYYFIGIGFMLENEMTTSFQCSIRVVFLRYVMTWKVFHQKSGDEEIYFLYNPSRSCFYLSFIFT
jgi:hypothetical protein